MKRTILAVGLLLSLVAVAQTLRYVARDARLEDIHLGRAADGGFVLGVEVLKRQDDGGTADIRKARECAVTRLNAAERACLATIRAAALACFVSDEGL